MTNKHYFLALNRIDRIGPRTIMKLLRRWPNLQEMFESTVHELVIAGMPSALAYSIKSFDLNLIDADLRWAQEKNHHLLTWADENYPLLLKEIDDPPAVLYARGDMSAVAQIPVAMVGTRKPSISGQETARYFARALSSRHITIVSGLALGIDAQAHQGSLDVGGKTVAVMGTGIDCIYPRQHKALSEEICQNGLILTEFPLKTTPNPGHFPRRNRIISGLSRITLIVEAAIKSGSLITARLALEQNRDVLAIPGSILNPQARGCHHLLQQGAKLVTSVEDVLDELKIDYDLLNKVSSPLREGNKEEDTLFRSKRLAPENQNLVKCIGYEITSVDQIVRRSGQGVSDVTSQLAQLELQGLIKAVTGGYMRCAHEREFV